MTDFLAEKRREIQARLKELKPLVDEYQQLEAAERALAGVDGGARASAPAPTRTRAPRATAAAKRSRGGETGRRGRPKGSGKRATEALDLVKSRPGITIPEIAAAMGIKQNYLYRVVPDLEKQGLITKSGRGWHLRQ